MTNIIQLKIGEDRTLPAIRVVGFHGQVLSDETPAKCSPVYADQQGHLVRLMQSNGHIVLQRAAECIADADPLPGEGTRIGPWSARWGYTVFVMGPDEKQYWPKLVSQSRPHEPRRVLEFLHWFSVTKERSDQLCAEWVGNLAVWYCDMAEAFALLERVHRVAEENLFKMGQSNDRDAIIQAAFWLSRAAVSDQDIFLAAAGLKRAGWPEWEMLVREGLGASLPITWEKPLAQAEDLLQKPPLKNPSPELAYTRDFRKRVRSLTTVKEATSCPR